MPKIVLGDREFRLSGAEKKHLTESVAGEMDGLAKAVRKARKDTRDESCARAEIYRKLLKPDDAEMLKLSERRSKRMIEKFEQRTRAQKGKSRGDLRRRNFCLGHGTCFEPQPFDFAQDSFSIPFASGLSGAFAHVEQSDPRGAVGTHLLAANLSIDMSDWAMCAFWHIPDITGTLTMTANATINPSAELSPFWFDSPTAFAAFNVGVLQFTRSPFTNQGWKAISSSTLFDLGWNLFGQTTSVNTRNLSLSVSTQVDPNHFFLCAAWLSAEITCSGRATVVVDIGASVNSFNVTVA